MTTSKKIHTIDKMAPRIPIINSKILPIGARLSDLLLFQKTLRPCVLVVYYRYAAEVDRTPCGFSKKV
jgi:hypothetical protein